MENLSMCRICLATGVRLRSLASHLRDLYERITALTREDGRPLVACYICHARLQNCYRLRTCCLRSEELLTEMMSSGVLKPQDVLSTNPFSVVSAVHISIGHMLQESTECHIKEEAPEITCDVELDLQYTKDMLKEEHDAQIDENNQCSHLEDPLDIIKEEVDDVDTDAEYINLKDETLTIEENCWEPDIAGLSSQPADNICPKIVKVVLERIDLYDTRIGTRFSKNNKIAAVKDTEDTTTNKRKIECIKNEKIDTMTIKESKIVTKEIKILETCDKVDKCDSVNKCDDNLLKSVDNDVCEEKSTNEASLEQNFTSVSSTKSKQFACNTCMKWFNKRGTLKQHIRIHTGEKPYQCNVCKKCFTQTASLQAHIRIHTGEKPNQCNICNKRFIKKSDLKKHIRAHTGEKPYRCNVCKNCFSQTSHLQRHMRIHTGEKPHACNVCKKCFNEKCDLRIHIMTHTGEKPHQCNVCKKYFNRKHDLKSHTRTHTGEKPYQCNVCKKCFSDSSYYSKHIRKHKR